MNRNERVVHRDSVDYWRRVTEEHDPRHPTAKDDVFTRYFGLLSPRPGQAILDVGIGFGRFVPHYLNAGLTVTGIDIDPNMAQAVRNDWPDESVEIHVCPCESSPITDGSIDLVVCWGVFDELNQGAALTEMSRVMKTGGRLLLTGKNTDYFPDDAEARAAEEGARAKNHPNHFTDVKGLDLAAFGLTLVAGRYFPRRGDIVADQGLDVRPDYFYEYILVLEKIGPIAFPASEPPTIAHSVSRTQAGVSGL